MKKQDYRQPYEKWAKRIPKGSTLTIFSAETIFTAIVVPDAYVFEDKEKGKKAKRAPLFVKAKK